MFQGATPTLNRELPDMIKRFKEFSTIDLATHGLCITPKLAESIAKCDTVSVSIDGVTQEVYEKYRVCGRLDDAIMGMKTLLAAGAKVNWTFVVMKHNEHQIPEAMEIAKNLGVKFGAKPPLFWDRSKMDEQMPSDEKYRRYTYDIATNRWALKADRLKCREFWETIYVLPNGSVVTCCYDGAAEYVVGNVKETSLLDVWNGEKYTKMRNLHSGGTLNPLCEKYCNLPG